MICACCVHVALWKSGHFDTYIGSGHSDHFWTPLWGVFWSIHTRPVDDQLINYWLKTDRKLIIFEYDRYVMFLITFLINFYVWVSDDLCMLRTCCVVEKWSFWHAHRMCHSDTCFWSDMRMRFPMICALYTAWHWWQVVILTHTCINSLMRIWPPEWPVHHSPGRMV